MVMFISINVLQLKNPTFKHFSINKLKTDVPTDLAGFHFFYECDICASRVRLISRLEQSKANNITNA
jgi:hypothetical protein